MRNPFHAGELAVQRRAGVTEAAQAVGGIIGRRVSPAAARFLSRQRLAVASTLDVQGRVWASLLTGQPGFLTTLDSGSLRITGDPIPSHLTARPEIGLLVIDLRTRQRLRFNGRASQSPDGLVLSVAQAYGNCPKYIQLREEKPDAPTMPEAPRAGSRLDARQSAVVDAADTFFIATFHPEGGADASHRGGLPGFVHVLDEGRLAFPDYPGNAMFNTLGNLVEYPSVGLLFVDFETGDVLQITGGARLESDRSVVVEIDEVRESRSASPLRYRLVQYSPANPPLRHADTERGISRSERGDPRRSER